MDIIRVVTISLPSHKRPKKPSGQSHEGRLLSSSVQIPSFSQTISSQVLVSKNVVPVNTIVFIILYTDKLNITVPRS